MINPNTKKEPFDRNVLILGAGFSAPAGAPLINDFLDKSRRFKDDPSWGLDAKARDYFEEVFRFRREMAQAREKVLIDLDNIEELFGLVELRRRLGGETEATSDATVFLIAKTLQLAVKAPGSGRLSVRFEIKPEYRQEFDSVNQSGLFTHATGWSEGVFSGDIYDYFIAMACGLFDDPTRRPARATTFITFNYDLIVDHALNRLGMLPDYQLVCAVESPNELHDNRRKCGLLKLHGSANWGVCTFCGDLVHVSLEKVIDSPEEFRSQTCEQCGKQQFQPLLIPPSWDKSGYSLIMTPVWEKAVAELKAATRICIIGYSMPQSDLFFKYLLTLALAENHGLSKLLVVDRHPPAPNLEERYCQLLDPVFRDRRFSFKTDGFEMFFGSGTQALTALGRGEMLGGNIGWG